MLPGEDIVQASEKVEHVDLHNTLNARIRRADSLKRFQQLEPHLSLVINNHEKAIGRRDLLKVRARGHQKDVQQRKLDNLYIRHVNTLGYYFGKFRDLADLKEDFEKDIQNVVMEHPRSTSVLAPVVLDTLKMIHAHRTALRRSRIRMDPLDKIAILRKKISAAYEQLSRQHVRNLGDYGLTRMAERFNALDSMIAIVQKHSQKVLREEDLEPDELTELKFDLSNMMGQRNVLARGLRSAIEDRSVKLRSEETKNRLMRSREAGTSSVIDPIEKAFNQLPLEERERILGGFIKSLTQELPTRFKSRKTPFRISGAEGGRTIKGLKKGGMARLHIIE
ncbi:MAG TPA: hypothetical protein VGQ00_04590 [Candidatus Norongarragalinales archaeon]|jgi:hypothetical protein|nr:hypothetical protein [Candidatus Norongarragalinales archaeon]